MTPDEPPPRPPGRRVALAVSALGVVAVLGVGWAYRIPIASAFVSQYFAGRGVESSFVLERLDFGGARVRALRLGPEGSPDLTLALADAQFAWAPLPTLGALRLEAPALRARVDQNGLSLGSLDALLAGGGSGAGGGLPKMQLEIADGAALIATPYGVLPVALQSQGRIGTDFSATGRMALAETHGEQGAMRNARGELDVRADGEGLTAALALGLEGLALRDGGGAENAVLEARLAAPVDLTRGGLTASLRAGALNVAGVAARETHATAELASDVRGLQVWEGDVALTTAARDATVDPAWSARDAGVAGTLKLDLRGGFAVNADGRVRVAHGVLEPAGRRALVKMWPALGVLPVGPLSDGARDGVADTLQDAAIDAAFMLDPGGDGLVVRGPATIVGANGARIEARPIGNTPVFRFDDTWSGATRLVMSGAGLPPGTIDVTRYGAARDGAITAEGVAQIPAWRNAQAAFTSERLRFDMRMQGARGTLALEGPAVMSGPLASAVFTDLAAPLDLAISWGDGVRVAPASGRCIQARFAELRLPGLVFRDGAAPLCADEAGLFAVDAQGRPGGGVTIEPIALSGYMDGAPAQTARLEAPQISVRFGGSEGRLVLDALVERPQLDVRLAPDHQLRVSGARITAQMVAANDTWRATGVIADGVVDDATLPAHITAFQSRFEATPRGNDALVRFHDGVADVTDRAPLGAVSDRRPAFNPMRANDMEATLVGGRLDARGKLVLTQGARALGTFEATHALESGVGEATVRTGALTFDTRLQLYEISELARGTIENVRGALDATVVAHWTKDTFTADGRVRADNLSFASSTMPVVEGVTGEVVFDDLLGFTTPPGQVLNVGLLNPGVPVSNGVIRFQLLPQGAISLEDARWPFAGGVLAIAPTRVTLNAEETRLNLTLADVDVATLLAQLNVPDLAATGEVGGSFPVVLTPTSARIENGQLRTSAGGGTISYAGQAGRETQGVARLAFSALTSFRYDDLSLELNGDLAGELVTAINFSGRNSAGLALTEGGGGPLRANVAGVPFVFNVKVTAPFRQLGQMAATAFDAQAALQQAGESLRSEAAPGATPGAAPEAGNAVDQPAPPPR